MDMIQTLAAEFKLRSSYVEKTIELIDEGNTIPFIARYRKEVTGGMSDTTLRDLGERLTYLRGLEERKEEVLRLIDEQGKLTDELREQIEDAQVLQRVEDLYKPYKQKRATRASKARERGLEPLARVILAQEETAGDPSAFAREYVNPEKEVETAADALQGACDIIAEEIAEDADRIQRVRTRTWDKGRLATEAADPEEKTVYDMYYDKSEPICRIPNHRVLAINRGEKEKKLKVRVDIEPQVITEQIEDEIITGGSIFEELLRRTCEDAYKRLIAPSVEREMRNQLTERAEAEAVKVFAKNTENLLMQPPVRNKKVISIDPGYRTGCKVAALSGTGKLLAYGTVYPTKPKEDIAGTERTLQKIIDKYGCDIIVIGNGTASRETEEVIARFLKKTGAPIQYTIVNEAGASVYSASKLAAEEYPNLDVTTRGAMSLGRRLQDPLAELVKIDPKHIGVGQYQHDINQKLLDGALTGVVENCVNRVGVDLNTASPSLLSYIAGIKPAVARNIVAYREEHGRFKGRRELLKVAGLGPKAFEQCAGFLRIEGGSEPLDSTSVHPESYEVTRRIMEKIGITGEDITSGGAAQLDAKIIAAYPVKREKKRGRRVGLDGLKDALKEQADDGARLADSVRAMAEDMGIGRPTLNDIIAELKKPARDPREDAPPVIFRNDVRSFDDLEEGMELEGTVRNVVDFGAFVDIGVKQDGLVHISQMSRKYVGHPMDVVSVGDTVKVKILGVDRQRQKISLTMIV
ncbi:MAG: RNA-binding transcriptional accessory protein [Firmicutes bacterium]|nr:RNA-binding transcriptional accessory protein [Bacillota bacterium]